MLAGYLNYMKEVLGVREVLLAPVEDDATAVAEEAQTPPIEVLFLDAHKWSPAAADLFQKMREAMKLTEDQVMIHFQDELSATDLQIKALQAREIVSFDAGIYENLKPQFENILTLTIGPEKLLKDAAQKKITWLALQMVMKRLH